MWLRRAQLNLLTLPLRAYGGNNHHLVFTRVIPINQKSPVGFEPTLLGLQPRALPDLAMRTKPTE